MISRVAIKNFKSIGELGVDLELKPLTLLVGPNGGGKSSILEAIAVASQSDVSGRLTAFPSRPSVVNKPDGSTAVISVEFSEDSNFGSRLTISRELGRASLIHGSVTNNPEFEPRVNDLRSKLGSDTFLLSSIRGNVPYTADTSSVPQWVGVYGENLLILLAIIFGQRLHEKIANKIVKWANRFGIGKLNAGIRGGNQSGSDYEDAELETVLDLALASSGSKQILTVITQLFWAPEGSLLMIEEPEISLHPKAQMEVLEMFSEALKEDKQIIATTHSIVMLQALGYAVLQGWLTPEQIAVYHIEKGPEGTTAQQLPLDKNGYIQDWVPSFTEVERQMMREWAKSVPRE